MSEILVHEVRNGKGPAEVRVDARNTLVQDPREFVSTFPSSPDTRVAFLKQLRAAATAGEISFLKYWRVAAEMDQKTLAERAGMSQPEIARAERVGQTSTMQGKTLRRLATALRVPIEFILAPEESARRRR
jgi:Helix-turn-helix